MLNLLPHLKRKAKSLSPIGLDIGPHAIRAAQLERCGDRWRIVHVTRWERREAEAEPIVSEGFAQRFRRVLNQSGYRGRLITAGLSTPEVELHALEIPDRGELRSPEKFKDAVRWELERVTGFSDSPVVTSHWRLPASKGTRTTTIGVAASAPQVKFGTDLAVGVGKECERVDATACALSRLGVVARRGPEQSDDVWGVLDLGARQSRIVVCVADTPVLVRSLGGGGQSWTERIAESLHLSTEAAELHKRDHGIGADTEINAPHGSAGASAEIAEMIRKSVHIEIALLADEIERSYEYVLRCYAGRKPGGLLLVGGGANLRGLKQSLTKKLGIKVARLDDITAAPGSALLASTSIREPLGTYACAIGLAIEPENPE